MSKDAGGGPAGNPNRLHKTQTSTPVVKASVPGVNQAVADKLWRLHWDLGYFTRAELLAEVGPPRDRREAAA